MAGTKEDPGAESTVNPAFAGAASYGLEGENAARWDEVAASNSQGINQADYSAEEYTRIKGRADEGMIQQDAVTSVLSKHSLHKMISPTASDKLPSGREEIKLNINGLNTQIDADTSLNSAGKIQMKRALSVVNQLDAKGMALFRGNSGKIWIQSADGSPGFMENGILEIATLLDKYNPSVVPSPPVMEGDDVEAEEHTEEELQEYPDLADLDQAGIKAIGMTTADNLRYGAIALDVSSTLLGMGIKLGGYAAGTVTAGAGAVVGQGAGAVVSLVGGIGAMGMDLYANIIDDDVTAWQTAKELGIRAAFETAEAITFMPSFVSQLSKTARIYKQVKAAVMWGMTAKLLADGVGGKWMDVLAKDATDWDIDDYRTLASMITFTAAVGTGHASKYFDKKALRTARINLGAREKGAAKTISNNISKQKVTQKQTTVLGADGKPMPNKTRAGREKIAKAKAEGDNALNPTLKDQRNRLDMATKSAAAHGKKAAAGINRADKQSKTSAARVKLNAKKGAAKERLNKNVEKHREGHFTHNRKTSEGANTPAHQQQKRVEQYGRDNTKKITPIKAPTPPMSPTKGPAQGRNRPVSRTPQSKIKSDYKKGQKTQTKIIKKEQAKGKENIDKAVKARKQKDDAKIAAAPNKTSNKAEAAKVIEKKKTDIGYSEKKVKREKTKSLNRRKKEGEEGYKAERAEKRGNIKKGTDEYEKSRSSRKETSEKLTADYKRKYGSTSEKKLTAKLEKKHGIKRDSETVKVKKTKIGNLKAGKKNVDDQIKTLEAKGTTLKTAGKARLTKLKGKQVKQQKDIDKVQQELKGLLNPKAAKGPMKGPFKDTRTAIKKGYNKAKNSTAGKVAKSVANSKVVKLPTKVIAAVGGTALSTVRTTSGQTREVGKAFFRGATMTGVMHGTPEERGNSARQVLRDAGYTTEKVQKLSNSKAIAYAKAIAEAAKKETGKKKANGGVLMARGGLKFDDPPLASWLPDEHRYRSKASPINLNGGGLWDNLIKYFPDIVSKDITKQTRSITNFGLDTDIIKDSYGAAQSRSLPNMGTGNGAAPYKLGDKYTPYAGFNSTGQWSDGFEKGADKFGWTKEDQKKERLINDTRYKQWLELHKLTDSPELQAKFLRAKVEGVDGKYAYDEEYLGKFYGGNAPYQGNTGVPPETVQPDVKKFEDQNPLKKGSNGATGQLAKWFKISDLFNGKTKTKDFNYSIHKQKANKVGMNVVQNMPGFSERQHTLGKLPNLSSADSYQKAVTNLKSFNTSLAAKNQNSVQNAAYVGQQRGALVEKEAQQYNQNVAAQNANNQMQTSANREAAAGKAAAWTKAQDADRQLAGRRQNALGRTASGLYNNQIDNQTAELQSKQSDWVKNYKTTYDAAIKGGKIAEANSIREGFYKIHQMDPDDIAPKYNKLNARKISSTPDYDV